MAGVIPLSLEERQRIYAGWVKDQPIARIASELGRSPMTVRKWWRRMQRLGLAGLQAPRRGRPARGVLSQFSSAVKNQAVALKRAHPRWGAARVLVELQGDPQVQGLRLPSRSRLAAAFKQLCPEALKPRVRRSAPVQAPPRARGVHEVWQIDHQEKVVLQDGTLATVCNVRDPVGAAMLGSYAFSTQTAKRWRKLTTAEVQAMLRRTFQEWHTLPDCVLTDNELGMAGSPQELFPSRLTLWLRGLGVTHARIRPHRPTDQPHIERQHRTLDNFTADAASRANLTAFQAALDRERAMYNRSFPCRASDCHGQPPLTTHPELLQPRRPFPPEGEWALFDLQRVFDYLATFTFERRISSIGVLSVGHVQYYLGRPCASKHVWVRCEPTTHEWLVWERRLPNDPATETLVARRPIRNLDLVSLTGLEPQPVTLAQPLQLTLPCFTA